MSFYVEENRCPAWRKYGSVESFRVDVPARVAELVPVQDAKQTLGQLREDRSMFPIRRQGTYEEVTEWIQETVTQDREFAVAELNPRARVRVELRLYHAAESGLWIRTMVHAGESGTGHIIWSQVVVRLGKGDYLWWSHD